MFGIPGVPTCRFAGCHVLEGAMVAGGNAQLASRLHMQIDPTRPFLVCRRDYTPPPPMPRAQTGHLSRMVRVFIAIYFNSCL